VFPSRASGQEALRHGGSDHGSLRNIVSANPKLRAHKNEVRETKLDEAERKLDEHIYEQDNLQALLEYLKAVGGSRGYGNSRIDMHLEAKVEHSAEEELLKGLIDKFSDKLKDDDNGQKEI
jgi:hypothetical protein